VCGVSFRAGVKRAQQPESLAQEASLGQGWVVCAPRNAASALSSGLKRLASLPMRNQRSWPEVTAALRSTCFQRAVAVDGARRESTAGIAGPHTIQLRPDHQLRSMWVGPLFPTKPNLVLRHRTSPNLFAFATEPSSNVLHAHRHQDAGDWCGFVSMTSTRSEER